MDKLDHHLISQGPSVMGGNILHPMLNVNTVSSIKKILSSSGKDIDAESLIKYLNLTGYHIDMERVQSVVKEAIDIYTRYSDYRKNVEENVFIPKNIQEFESLKNIEIEQGGKTFALSSHDILEMIETHKKKDVSKKIEFEENRLYECICKDATYLTSYINNLNLFMNDSKDPMPIYGFYKYKIGCSDSI